MNSSRHIADHRHARIHLVWILPLVVVFFAAFSSSAKAAFLVGPVVTGTPTEGQTLTTSNGLWSQLNQSNITYQYKWQRCDLIGPTCTYIAGATSNQQLLTAGDVGFQIRSEVTASDGVLTQIQSSLFTTVIAAAPLPEAVPDTPAASTIEADPAKFSVDVATQTQSMERAEFTIALPEAGRGTFTGTVVDDTRHLGAEDDRRTSVGEHYVAFSRTFTNARPGRLELPATLSARAMDKIRQRGFLRVTLTTKFTPAGSKTTQVYRKIVKLRPFAVTAYSTSDDSKTVTATLRTPRSGRLAVKFILRDRLTGESITVKTFATSDLAGGSYDYSAHLTEAARRSISLGKVRLMVKAQLDTDLYSARMLRSRFIKCSDCGAR